MEKQISKMKRKVVQEYMDEVVLESDFEESGKYQSPLRYDHMSFQS